MAGRQNGWKVGEMGGRDKREWLWGCREKNKRKQQKVAEALKSQSIYSVSSTVIVVWEKVENIK